jgi:hypothetical protein
MRIWLDDERPMPQGYDLHVKTATEAIALLRGGQVTCISLDHDLGFEWNGTGYDVAVFIEEGAHRGTLKPIRVKLHTANPVGRRRMAQAIQSAKRAWMGHT